MAKPCLRAVAFLVVSLMAAPAAAEADEPRMAALTPAPGRCQPACPDLACALEAARCMLEADDPRAARELLKERRRAHPEDISLQLLLARAYLALGNKVWAHRVLGQLASARPDDCQVRAWRIWLHIQLAEIDLAGELLQEDGCPDPGPQRTRWALLRAAVARHGEDPDAAASHVSDALDQDEIYAEDEGLLRDLKRSALPGRQDPLSIRMEVGGGYTSNGLASSPLDVGGASASTDTGSPVVMVDLLARFQPHWHRLINPLLELSLRSLILTRQEVVLGNNSPYDFTYLNLAVRPGISLGSLRVYYHGQLFMIAGDDPPSKGLVSPSPEEEGPRWFYESHRAEAELEPRPWITLFAGGGRTIFRERIRTRSEVDGGLGIHGSAWKFRLLGGLSVRGHWGGEGRITHTYGNGSTLDFPSTPYDLFGGTLLGSVTLPLHYLSLRVRGIFSFDNYLRSQEYFDSPLSHPDDDPSETRLDFLIKGGLEAWSMAFSGLRAGLSYEVSHRASNKGAYSYTDHRVLLRLRLSLSLDPFGPSTTAGGQSHEPLPYQAEQGDSLDDERIQDMLRQEDAARRGSSCIN